MPGDSSSSASSAEINAGPHNSKIANKLDPRVDSDLGMWFFIEALPAHPSYYSRVCSLLVWSSIANIRKQNDLKQNS